LQEALWRYEGPASTGSASFWIVRSVGVQVSVREPSTESAEWPADAGKRGDDLLQGQEAEPVGSDHCCLDGVDGFSGPLVIGRADDQRVCRQPVGRLERGAEQQLAP
jgi:hypothetical protein